MDKEIWNCLEQIKDMMAQEYTISHHSILSDSYIKNQFILSVKQNDRLDEFDETIKRLLEINRSIRARWDTNVRIRVYRRRNETSVK